MRDKILAVISEALGSSVTPVDKLEDLAMDSLDFLQLMLALREQIGPIEDAEFVAFVTVDDIVRHYEAQ